MSQSFLPSFSRTVERIKKHPQLFWTLFVAVVITVGFIIIAQLFISIAQDAQSRLVNVRIGSIQDSLSEFVVLDNESKEKVDSAIINLIAQNPTIMDFTFYKKVDGQYVVYASSNKSLVGTSAQDISLVGQLALNDPRNSYTTELQSESERMYQTFRSLNQNGEVVGLIETTQTLSQADQVIEQNIQKGIIIFVCILLFIMFLFFKHSRIIDYTTLYSELKKVDELKDDFISMASHELKTPLTTIRGYSEFITEGETVPAEYKEYSRRIDVSSRQLAFLVEDMLDVSRIEQGRMTLDLKRVLVPDFIQSLLPDFESLSKEKGLSCMYVHEGLSHPYIKADENRLRQILVNLVGNSIKYTKKGEVKITLSNIKEKIEIRISDTGIGMSEEERKGLFKKFYRIQNSETQEIKGTGLGLWITKELIEKMGGTLSVESIKGVGTHMIVVFDATI